MNILRKVLVVCLVFILGLLALQTNGKVALSQSSNGSDPLAVMQVEPNKITWNPLIPYDHMVLTVVNPDGSLFTKTFSSDEIPALELNILGVLANTTGQYTYELRLIPALDAATQATLAAAADNPESRIQVVDKLNAEGKLPTVTVFGGTFAVFEGHFVLPMAETGKSDTAQTSPAGGLAPNDIIHADDVIITGSLCVGFDCLTDGTENFGFDTIKLKENNLRIFFDDTSATAGFAANDWRLVINDSASGGANYFAIEDSTAARTPYRIDAGAPNNSLYVSSTGRIGMGTNTPMTKLHLVLGDTPAIRLDQDASSGWTPQVWDVAGNESNFFVRDITNGSKLPFRIQPNSPANSFTIKADGKVGLGTWSPAYSVEMERTGQDAAFAVDRTDGATAILSSGTTGVRIGSVTNHNVDLVVNNTPVLTLNSLGNATLQGALSEYSDVNAKENFTSVNVYEVLNRLNGIPVMTWNYRIDTAQTLHMGPTAQDFYTAFSLGSDNLHIAPLDVNGVSLAAIQALTKITTDQKNHITQLETDNTALRQKVDSLESRITLLEQAVSTANPTHTSGLTFWSVLIVVLLAVGLMQIGPAIYRRYHKVMTS
jgi:hypothetical protein